MSDSLLDHDDGDLTSAAIIEKFQSVQMIDIHLPTTDGRRIVMSRYTEPEPDIQLLLSKLDLILPPQLPPENFRPRDFLCSADLNMHNTGMTALKIPDPLELRKTG